MDPQSKDKHPFRFELGVEHGDKTLENSKACVAKSDFVIICKGKEHKVAKEMLSTKSSVLDAICKTRSSLTINHVDTQTAVSLIDYINHGEYHAEEFVQGIFPLQNPPPGLRKVISSIEVRPYASGLHRNHGVTGLSALVARHKPNLWVHLELYHLALEYKLQGLQDLSASKFRIQAAKHKDSLELSSILAHGLPFAMD